MRRWLAVILGLLAGGGLLLGLAVLARGRSDPAAERLLRAALEQGVATPVRAAGETAVLADSAWRRSRVALAADGRLARVTLRSANRTVALADDGQGVWRLDEARRTATRLGSSDRAVQWGLLQRNYRVTRVPSASLGGRRAEGVAVTRRRGGRLALALWIDPETRAILRRLCYDADGHLVAQSQVDTLTPAAGLAPRDVGPPARWELVDGDPEGARRVSPAEFRGRAPFEPRAPRSLPRGFSFQGLYLRACPHGCAFGELRYSDGLRVLSVYERQPCGWGRGAGRRGHRAGRGCGYGPPDRSPVLIDQGQAKTVRHRRADLRIVVTADLTARELLAVIRSIP